MRERYLALLEELRGFHTTFTKEDELILRARFLRVIQDYYNVDESYDTPEDDDLFDEMNDNSDYKRVEKVGRALDWKYRDCSNTISHQDVLTTMMYCFESCIRSHKTTGVVEAYVSTGGVTIKTNSVRHSIEVSFDVFQYTVNDEDDTFAEPDESGYAVDPYEIDTSCHVNDESERSAPFTPLDKVSTVSIPSTPSDISANDKGEEDKGSGIDYYSGCVVDPYAIDTSCQVDDKCEDPDRYPENYYPDSPR